jgi:predicted dehydrogenase
MHYAEVMDFARSLVREGTLGEITTSHFHGGCPSGAGAELWSRLDTNPGGLIYEEGCHTLENIIDLFGLPNAVSASVRKLPPGRPHPIISCFYDMDRQALDPKTTMMAVGDIFHEDIGSVILEYELQNVLADFTSWEPTYWCEDWTIDIYGTNGVFHGTVNPPRETLILREARDGFPQANSSMPTEQEKGVRNEKSYYARQIDLFLKRSMEYVDTEKCDMYNQVKLMKVLQAIYKSAKDRKFIELQGVSN